MRDDYHRFRALGAEVLAIAPDTVEHARAYFAAHDLPFPCLADPEREVFRRYDVVSRLWSLGQRPGLFVVDRSGLVRFAHVGAQQWEIPTNRDVLDRLERLAAERPAEATQPGDEPAG